MSVGVWVDPRTTVQPEVLSQWIILMIKSGIEPDTYRIVVQFYRNALFVNDGLVGNSTPPPLHDICIERGGPHLSPSQITWPCWSVQLASPVWSVALSSVPLSRTEMAQSWQILVPIWVQRNYNWPLGDTALRSLASAAIKRPNADGGNWLLQIHNGCQK